MDTLFVIVRSGKGNSRAEADEFLCGLADCPLRAQGRCIQLDGLIHPKCPYGKVKMYDGPTKRAKGHLNWVNSWKVKNTGDWKGWNKVAYIGEYVYLPYSHMDSDRLPYGQAPLPFEEYSSFFNTSDKPFIPRSMFDAEMVVKAAKLRPQAMVGGTITKYVQEIVPKFLLDVMELDPDLFNATITIAPELLKRIEKYTSIDIPASWLDNNGFMGSVYVGDDLVRLERGWLEWEWQGDDGQQFKQRQRIQDQVVNIPIDRWDRKKYEDMYKRLFANQ